MPFAAEASIFSLLSKDVYAKADISATTPRLLPLDGVNLQTISLLEANVSSAAILQEKEEKSNKAALKKDDKEETSEVDDASTIQIVSEMSLLPQTGPMGVSDGKDTPNSVMEVEEQTSVYVVKQGDTFTAIADMYDVTVNTVLWYNDKKKTDKPLVGELLFIPPISGVEHQVKSGQTCQSIAKTYKVDATEIVDHNGLEADCKLVVGEKLFIPNAEKTEESDKPVKNLAASTAKDKKYYESHPTQNLSGYYINPVPGYRKSQGIHDKNAIDMAIATGTPIRAAASGKVTLARDGYNGGFGNFVIISHSNGTETLYAHMSKIATTTGAQVKQGEIIGYVGSTGRSTGPHLHFEVHGARNPGADNSWAK